MKIEKIEIINHYHEEIYRGYEISIKPNLDQWRDCFEWSICKGDSELRCELAFTMKDALAESYAAVTSLEN